jgi:hypothetical protein
VQGCRLEIIILLLAFGKSQMGSFVCVSSLLLKHQSLYPLISSDDALDSSIKIITTEDDVTSSKKNLQAAGSESSAKETKKIS